MRRAMAVAVVAGLGIVFAVILTASLVLPVSTTYEVKLVLSPSTRDYNVSISRPFEVTCKGDPSDDKFSNMNWINPKGERVSDGHPSVLQSGPTSLKLLFTDPKADDSGIYGCTAQYGKEHDLKIEVSINFFAGSAPTFQTKYERIKAEEGSEVEVTCSAMGDKPITYTWYNQNEQVIQNDWNSSISTSKSEDGSTLAIRPVRLKDEGSYTCTASNFHGLSSKVYDITVTPSTNNDTKNETAIRHIRIKNVTANSVQFDISTSDEVSSIEVVYKESKELIEYRKEWKRGDAYIARNLIPAGLYNFHFRAISNNTDLEKDWSETLSVTMLPDAPEVIFRSLGTDSLKIEWFRGFDEIMRGTVDKYQLKYYRVQIENGRTWRPSDCLVTIELPTCSGTSYTIAGLSSKVYYELQMQAHTASGYGNPFKQKIYVS